ncbi:MAG: hypothetical protein GC185_00625 [Alphaproteobacteria bacterium]|nr:hypothetical protein [Alphaproteobacteria bacterium]
MLFNIAKTEENPLYIDASDITALHVDAEKEELRIFNGKGELLWINSAQRDVEVEDLLARLAQKGDSFVPFPVRDEGGKEYMHHVSPAAVTFITVSKPAKDGNLGVIAGVRGVGREETWSGGMTQAEFDTLLKAVRKAKPVMEYAPEDAYSRWAAAAALYIDPKSVTQLQDQGSQVIVNFESSGSLDVQVKEIGIEPFLPPDYVRGEQSERNKQQFNMAFGKLMAYQNSIKDEMKQARFDFAAQIAAANDKLIAVPSQDRAIYISKEDVANVSFAQDDDRGSFYLGINPQKSADNPYASGLTVMFKSAAERKKAFDALDKAVSAPAPARKPTPPPSIH